MRPGCGLADERGLIAEGTEHGVAAPRGAQPAEGVDRAPAEVGVVFHGEAHQRGDRRPGTEAPGLEHGGGQQLYPPPAGQLAAGGDHVTDEAGGVSAADLGQRGDCFGGRRRPRSRERAGDG